MNVLNLNLWKHAYRKKGRYRVFAVNERNEGRKGRKEGRYIGCAMCTQMEWSTTVREYVRTGRRKAMLDGLDS